MSTFDASAADLSNQNLPHPKSASEEPFSDAALSRLARLRAALEQAVYGLTKGLQTSRDLQNLIAVDRNLSWQIFRILGPVETLSTLPYIPGAASMNKLLGALKKHGVAPESIKEAGSAFAEFENFVEATAGDRDRFETMVLSASNSSEAQQIDFQHRKAAFKAHSHFFGLEVDAVINSIFWHPNCSKSDYDVVALLDLVGMRRLRLDTDIEIHGAMYINKGNQSVRLFGTLNDRAADIYNAPLIPEFCTSPVPELETVTRSSGMVYTRLKSREIGLGKEIDLAMGRVYRDVSLSKRENGSEYIGGLIEMTRPTKLLVIDMLIHKSYGGNLSRYVAAYAHAPKEKTMPQVEAEGVRMPMREQFDYLGSGLDVCRVRETPHYLDLLRYTAEKMNWAVEDFDVYRVRVDCPLMDTTLVLRLAKPDPA